ncbi:MAG: hypothetical protein EA388_11850 [Nitriliruptor sp.]|nr:MAG: hypothetical protein EA388_11850 [Nitriliruptor sp.]
MGVNVRHASTARRVRDRGEQGRSSALTGTVAPRDGRSVPALRSPPQTARDPSRPSWRAGFDRGSRDLAEFGWAEMITDA